MASSQIEIKRSTFPKDFIFGAATSAYQIEGAWDIDGKGQSNWDRMTIHEPGTIADGSNGCVAIDHYNKFKEDVASLKKVGLDSYRFSISWPRIVPGGKLCGGICGKGIKYYNDLIDALLAEGIEPCATLFHWDVPQCLEDEYGGFLDRQIVEHFGEFAKLCFWEFGDRVKTWITLNEPWSFTNCGYVIARFPPRRGYNLATSMERALRSGILDHRSAINVKSLTSPEGDPVREIVEKARSLSYAPSSQRIGPRQIIIDYADNLPQVTSSEGNAVREVIAKAYNLPHLTSSEDATDDHDDSFHLPRVISSEDATVRRDYSFRTSREVHPVRRSVPQEYYHLPFYEADRVEESPMARNLTRSISSEEGSDVRESLPQPRSSKGDPGTEPYTVAHNLILAHALAVDIYRKHYQDHQQGKIGMTNVSVWYSPLDENKQEDIEAASRAIDFMLGWFVAPVITGDYPPSMRNNIRERLPKFTQDEVKLVKGSCDFLGINYYTARYAENIHRQTSVTHYQNDLHFMQHTHDRDGNPIGEQGGLSWFYIVPRGFYNIMLYVKERYNNPEILITENGFVDVNNKAITISKACIDEIRIKYYKEHLAALRDAIGQGVRLKGYFIWSFLDNFEWDSGYNGRFGIFYVDYKHGRLTRCPKNSALWWMNFLNKTRIPWNKVPRKQQDIVSAEEQRDGSAKRTKCN